MLSKEQRDILRDMRDETIDAEEKTALRVALNYIYKLESQLNDARTLARSIMELTKPKFNQSNDEKGE